MLGIMLAFELGDLTIFDHDLTINSAFERSA
jgi:hypothetical protein